MDSSRTPSPSEEVTDIYSLSDQVISEQLEFVEEIGNGNWGSVWLCRPKHGLKSPSDHSAFRNAGCKFAVKLVHRKKTSANASRVKSLWNEMKVVRSLKHDPHPSIIPFHSFVITPSFAMISMTYLPTLIPVEVDESKAREWFRFLLSGVDFLHKRGVVHNDIKPANIMVSHKNIPVFVDFGFAEQNDPEVDTSFHSNLAYGTPEYLSPERARGLSHDTRKSDIWSLGVTFFEILNGRTPFEEYDGETLQTTEDVERYWSRTLRGKWVGKWDCSKGIEKLLRRMMSPNADLRCTASQAIGDPYWNPRKETVVPNHRRSASYTSSIIFEKDMDKLLNMTPSSRKGDEGPISPPGLPVPVKSDSLRHSLAKSKSQPKVTASKIHPRKRALAPPAIDLSPIKASPPTSPYMSTSAKENMASISSYAKKDNTGIRRPFGAASSSNNANTPPNRLGVNALNELKGKRRSHVFGDLRNSHSSLSNENDKGKKKVSTNVKDRVKEWEREKQRLREMERLEELEKERDEHFEREKERRRVKEKTEVKKRERSEEKKEKEKKKSANPEDHDSDKENIGKPPASPPTLPLAPVMSPLTQVRNTLPAPTPMNTPAQPPTKRSRQNIFRHSIKASIDKTVQFYKSSSIGRAAGGSTPARGISFDIAREAETMKNGRDPKEEAQMLEEVVSPTSSALSPLPAIKNATMNELIAAESHMDRMTIWMRNVEKVVEEARANFAASAPKEASLPPLPVPLSRSQSKANRSSRLPRRVLAASQIFDEDGRSPIDQSFASNTPPSAYSGADTSNLASSRNDVLSNVVSPTESQFVIPEIHTPSRQRRATVSTPSPEPLISPRFGQSFGGQEGSLSQPRDKSKSHTNNLFNLRIAPLSLLEAELNKTPVAEPSPRLSDVLDRSLFIAQPLTSRDNLLDNSSFVITRDPSYDDLTSSPCHVEPYPLRHRPSQDIPIPDTPDRHRIENVYDRFLMATSGVKRNGKGYQSDNCGAVSNTIGLSVTSKRESHRAFYSARRPMPPPVSSEDQRRAVSVDELGMITHNEGEEGTTPISKDDGNTTVALVRRAFKSIVPGKAVVSRRLSRIY